MRAIVAPLVMLLGLGCDNGKIDPVEQQAWIEVIDTMIEKAESALPAVRENDRTVEELFWQAGRSDTGEQALERFLRSSSSAGALKAMEEGSLQGALVRHKAHEAEKVLVRAREGLSTMREQIPEVISDTREMLRIRSRMDDGLRRLRKGKANTQAEAYEIYLEILREVKTDLSVL